MGSNFNYIPTIGVLSVPSIFDNGTFYVDVFGYKIGEDPNNQTKYTPQFMITICRVNGKLWYIRNDIDPSTSPENCFLGKSAIFSTMVELEVMDCEAVGSFIWMNMINRFYRVRYREGLIIVVDGNSTLAIPPGDPVQSEIFEKIACVIAKTVRMKIKTPFTNGFIPVGP